MIVNCVVYQGGRRLRDIEIADITDYLGQPDCFVWVALADPAPEDIEHMQDVFSLHELAVEDTLHGNQRPKVEEYGECLFAYMRTLSVHEGEIDHGEMAVFVGADYILSVRSRSQQDFRNVRARCEREPHLLKLGPSFVLYALMDAVVDRYFPVVEALESELEAIEESIFVKNVARENIEHLYQLKRKATQVKHAVTPLAEALVHLFGGRVPTLSTNTQEYYRDVYDHLHRIETAIDSMRDTIVTAIQVNLSMVAIDEGEVHKRLAAWAAIFAVATVLAGIWGMNFEHMPELDWKLGYPMALGLMVTACGGLYYRFRKAGWL
ncbi:magnesium/cobalt transporter CorA [Modicisalibacter luteus]|jgi:magnesium transporter|uniref:Magnesium transport protein CorA n=1 Tax=Modicisalibacter luteus TaxID=453962 RepID=A0ABV7M292_9GAMM|nr:magnesium/cobalt transporter CorA [Halomonas lutea]GHA83526.1 magnesium transport protein CorA [Halomonas lutea]